MKDETIGNVVSLIGLTISFLISVTLVLAFYPQYYNRVPLWGFLLGINLVIFVLIYEKKTGELFKMGFLGFFFKRIMPLVFFIVGLFRFLLTGSYP